MFGSKSLNVPFLLKCDPDPKEHQTLAPKCDIYALPQMICATEQASEKYWSLKILNYRQRPYSQAEGDGEEPHISTPYSHYTSLFNSARFHSDRCDVKSLCKL